MILASLISSSFLDFCCSIDFNLLFVLNLVSCSRTKERIAENAANFDAFDEISNAIGDEKVSSWASEEFCMKKKDFIIPRIEVSIFHPRKTSQPPCASRSDVFTHSTKPAFATWQNTIIPQH